MPLTYSRYLQLEQLLVLQRPRSEGPAHDELLFIVIHQVHELWFKEVLHELDHLQALLEQDHGAAARMTLRRLRTIFKVMGPQMDVLETITPTSFAEFRPALETASGFQSFQFRELELTLGRRDPAVLQHHPAGTEEHRRLQARMARPSLWDSVLDHLRGLGHDLPDAAAQEGDAALHQALTAAYLAADEVVELFEGLMDLDEGLQQWRYRHVKMVERVIGTRRGTGGSDGAAYLKGTLFKPVFPHLWAIRDGLASAG